MTSSSLEHWQVQPTELIGTLAMGDLTTGSAFGFEGSWALLVPFVEYKLRVYGASDAGVASVQAIDLAGPNPELPGGNFAGIGHSSSRVAVSYLKDAAAGSAAEDSSAQVIVVYDTGTWAERARLESSTLGGRRAALAVFDDGRVVATAGNGLRIWAANLDAPRDLKLEAQPITLASLAGSNRLAAGLEDGSVVLIDADALSVIASAPAHPGPVECLSAAGTRLVSVGERGAAAVWRMD
jgi:hypothetical protein